MKLTDYDLHLFREGTHERLWERLGAHPETRGTWFLVWAPHAGEVGVAGDFNNWKPAPLESLEFGIWAGCVPGVSSGAVYKYCISSEGRKLWKADPFAFRAERVPGTASVVWDLVYDWRDSEWMKSGRRSCDDPLAIYEVHLGSWRHVTSEENGLHVPNYREIAPELAGYVKDSGFTHVELLPVTEYPYGGSWGYQPTGYFAPTSRYGAPQDFMFFVDLLHREGIGVILDWVPSHFAGDRHGLAEFDGAPLYESGREPQWGGHVFDYSRPEVRSFLRSSAAFWIERYHVDGLRIDAVAAIRQCTGGEAFLRALNGSLEERVPPVLLMAEDSSPEPGVTAPAKRGGLGFHRKWDMGWMHDTLMYITQPMSERSSHHDRLTFRPMYLWNERWVVPLSHDEVKPPFGSLLSKMPGDRRQKFANLRLLLAWMYAQPGAKLLFMGSEFGELQPWHHDRALDWKLLDNAEHAGIRNLVWLLNRTYRAELALHQAESDARCFEWIECCDEAHSVLSFLRKGESDDDTLLAVFNFSPAAHTNYRIGVPFGSAWRELLNTDAAEFGGTGQGHFGSMGVEPVAWQHQSESITLSLPPLTSIWLKPVE